MKRFFISILTVLTAHAMMAQGWPANYGGVMLQGFYWDSYTDTNWANLESQADELSQYFDLIWVPNSAYAGSLSNNMGYHPVYWFDHKSAFGTEAQLRSMINTFKQKGTGIIEDVVINHRAGVSNWVNFPAETYKGTTYQLGLTDICKDDECKDNGYTPTGAADTGQNWGGARDLDHTGQNVQKNVNAYLDFLLHDLGYVGFRYDFVLGYAPKYVGQYNKTAQPQFSVGECWENYNTIVNWLNGTKQDGAIQSAAFDFPTKYNINDVFSTASNWSKLDNSALATNSTLARYAVTFVDNHDTGRQGESPLHANVEAANAYILTLPGTPCVWLSHWKGFKTAIKKQVLTRKAAGINNESQILTKQASSNGYVLNVQGTKGSVLLVLGTAEMPTGNWKLAVEGVNYKMYVSSNVDISALDNVKEDAFDVPACAVVNEGETCAFFEAPTSYTDVKCWAWDSANNYTGGTWPGVPCTKVGTNKGKNVWKWTYTGTLTSQPTGIIFNGSFGQTDDQPFKNGGYYNEAGALQGVVTGIRPVTAATARGPLKVYTADGRLLQTIPDGASVSEALDGLPHGLYIVNDKKYAK